MNSEKLCTKCHKNPRRYINKRCKECSAEEAKKSMRRLREKFIKIYGGKCNCCGEKHFEFLALDHVHGDGAAHRKGKGPYRILKEAIESFGDGRFRLLCHNCNFAIGKYGHCPHNFSGSSLWLPKDSIDDLRAVLAEKLD